MNRRVFETSVTQLSVQILQVIETFFQSQEIVFDRSRLLEQTSCDPEYLAREAHFFGAEVYPIEDDAAAV